MSAAPPPNEVDLELLPALVAEAARRSRVCWLSYQDRGEPAAGTVRDRLVWHCWHDDAVVVLSDPEEQQLDGVARSGHVDLVMRAKEGRGRLVTCPARVEPVPGGTPEWEAHAAALLGVRLNLADPVAALERWRRTATILRLVPVRPSGDAGR